MRTLNNFLDNQGRLTRWPAKQSLKHDAIRYIATKFENDKVYSESEVNRIINLWHTFNDYFILRRGMIMLNEMSRTKNGAEYWKTQHED